MFRRSCSAAALLGLFTACADDLPTPLGHFAAPRALAVAGSPGREALFVATAGPSALQVLPLQSPLAKLDAAPAPNPLLPLSLVVGVRPRALVAVGRYLLVLDGLDGRLRLLDADGRSLQRDATGAPIGPLAVAAGSTALDLVAAATCPGAGCLARVYVVAAAPAAAPVAAGDAGTLAGPASLTVFDLRLDAADQPSLTPVLGPAGQQRLPLPAPPRQLAVDPRDDTLFFTAADGPDLWALHGLASFAPTFTKTPLGGAGGALAVAADGAILAVARPDLQDLLFFTLGPAAGAAAPLLLDVNPVLMPPIFCLPKCGEMACAGTQLALNPGVCVDPADDLQVMAPPSPYSGLYLGEQPLALAAVAVPGRLFGSPDAACMTPSEPGWVAPPAAWPAALAVTTSEGSVFLVGLDVGSSPVRAQLLDGAACSAPTLRPVPGMAPLSEVLTACSPAPGSRASFACAQDVDAGAAAGAVLVQRGHLDGINLQLEWEAIVLESGGQSNGRLDAAGRLHVAGPANDLVPRGTPLAGGGVSPGDVVEILSPPRPSCASLAANPERPHCLERRLVGVEPQADGSWALALAPPLDPNCFAAEGLAYRVRAGGQFVDSRSGLQGSGRFASGQRRNLRKQRTVNGVVADGYGGLLQLQVRGFQVADTLDSCSLYGDDGSVAAGQLQDPHLARGRSYGAIVRDPFAPARAGQTMDTLSNSVQPPGTVPQAAHFYLPGPEAVGLLRPTVFVSFTGSNALLGWAPLSEQIGQSAVVFKEESATVLLR